MIPLAFAVLAAAQDATIQVGKGGLLFTPSSINATVGSVITFDFSGAPGNHTVAQSSFASPCAPLASGFDSGYVFVPNGTTTGFPTWNLTITDTKPIWFYCAQQGPPAHCTAGMVGAINAPGSGTNTFENFQSAAKAAASVVAPSPALSGVGAAATTGPGPLTGGFSGFDGPTGTAPAPSLSSSTTSTGSTSSSGTGSASPGTSSVGTTTTSSGTSSAGTTTSKSTSTSTSPPNSASSVSANGVVVFVAALFGIALL
ncbi:hypothetical protein A0H81_08145 [Grifola frondosa]|uniref:Extracellular serine-rich protein n=1 Tax=Grifola frondosa TaxID=5627 RepID=A0A1C7M9Y3_GRIFR|nr:hypothetical protein A0H81_08145 [Grifola frondosa]